MKKGRIIFAIAIVLALFLVAGIGLVSASLGCYCYGPCYYCDTGSGSCTLYEGPGACFCHNNPCKLVEHYLCCVP
jgi:hypothetical protein